jgi:hypothetical protein
MLIDKDAIVSHLHAKGRHEDAIKCDSELPEKVHAVQDVELLRQYGIDAGDVDEILSRQRPLD